MTIQFGGGGTSTFTTVPSAGSPTLPIGTGSFAGGAAPAFQGTSAIGLNMASGYGSNLLDLQVAGVSKCSVTSAGAVVAGAGSFSGSLTGATVASQGVIQSLVAPPVTSAYGTFNVGNGSYAGGIAPAYQGNASGAYYTLNAASGFTGQSISLQTAGVKQFEILGAGAITINPATGTVAPAAGGAGALPATPAGYLTITIGVTARQIPYY